MAGPGVGGQGNVSSLAWVQANRIDNLGSPDTFGGIPKPDSNIQVQAGRPVGALLPGTVTNVDTSSPWGYAVTVKLDQPLNPLATHTAYLHMGSVQVQPGQHVNVGDMLGLSGPPSSGNFQNAPLGFALYPGDYYGHDSAWSQMSFANLTGNGQLNPVPLLDQARGIAIGPQGQSQGAYAALQGKYQPGTCSALDIGCWMNKFGTTVHDTLVSWGEHIAIFVIALIFIIIGFMLLSEKTANYIASRVTMPDE